ncbi:MAG TPA: hypothetical protein VKV22_06235 [Rhodanobacteraceae bacterium]|nr:hypothetical protein [Rhodanobacteraceae bacterium]
MKSTWDNPQDVIDAVTKAQRTAGWNNRRGDVQAFDLPNRWGHERCRLYVVPARTWADRAWERQAAEWQRRHGDAA